MFEKVFLIVLGTILSIGGPFALYKGITYEIKKAMPPGYSLLCSDTGKFKWSGRGYTQGYGSNSKQGAINDAWRNHTDGTFTDDCEE